MRDGGERQDWGREDQAGEDGEWMAEMMASGEKWEVGAIELVMDRKRGRGRQPGRAPVSGWVMLVPPSTRATSPGARDEFWWPSKVGRSGLRFGACCTEAPWPIVLSASAVWQAGCLPGAGAAAVQWGVGRHPYLSPGLPQQDRLPGVPPTVSPLGPGPGGVVGERDWAEGGMMAWYSVGDSCPVSQATRSWLQTPFPKASWTGSRPASSW